MFMIYYTLMFIYWNNLHKIKLIINKLTTTTRTTIIITITHDEQITRLEKQPGLFKFYLNLNII